LPYSSNSSTHHYLHWYYIILHSLYDSTSNDLPFKYSYSKMISSSFMSRLQPNLLSKLSMITVACNSIIKRIILNSSNLVE
ncbi:hypothetical protein L9F63_013436, partial [Diploptera punctata]